MYHVIPAPTHQEGMLSRPIILSRHIRRCQRSEVASRRWSLLGVNSTVGASGGHYLLYSTVRTSQAYRAGPTSFLSAGP